MPGGAAFAASDIMFAAVATGRLYVVGSTEHPHTPVVLDDQFRTESDDKGKFQYELIYYPARCIVSASIDGKTYEAVVSNCGQRAASESLRGATSTVATRPGPEQSGSTSPQQPPVTAVTRPRAPGSVDKPAVSVAPAHTAAAPPNPRTEPFAKPPNPQRPNANAGLTKQPPTTLQRPIAGVVPHARVSQPPKQVGKPQPPPDEPADAELPED